MRKISISAFIIAVLLTGSLYLVNQRVNDLANKVASLIKVGASQSISSLTELTSLSHNDVLPITEVNGLTTKKVKWGTATSSLKVINDALYSPIIGSASITTLGTITTGTWNADTLTVAKGGTGSTSLIAYQLLAGNGTGAVTTFGNGTSGYVLTSNGAGALPSFQNVGVTLNNNNTWTGTNTFSATTTIDGALYGGNRFVDYLASTTISGASSPVAVFIATSTNAVWATNANNATTSDFLGFVRQNVTNGATTSVQIDGVVGGFTGLTAGKEYYASTTGVLSTVYNQGTAEIYVGRAVSSTQLLLDRKGDSWQYLGSASCSVSAAASSLQCDTTSSLFARFANVTITVGDGRTSVHTYIVSKNGANSMSMSTFTGSGASNNGMANSNAVFTATSSIRATDSCSPCSSGLVSIAATAYFYR